MSHINRMKENNHMIISTKAKKAFHKCFHDINSQKSRYRWKLYYFNKIKAIYEQPIANMILKRKDKDAFSHHFFST